MVIPASDDAAHRRLVDRVARALGHDLRTPLGTIVNYASLLEEGAVPESGAIRDVAARIREQAAAIAEAAQIFADSLRIAAAPPLTSRGEPIAMLHSLADEIGAGIRLRPLPKAAAAARGDVEFEARLLALAWRAFLMVERSARREAPVEAAVGITCSEEMVTIELGLDGALENGAPVVPLAAYLGGGEPRIAPLRRLALEVGEELVAARGGALELLGARGRDVALRVRIPRRESRPNRP